MGVFSQMNLEMQERTSTTQSGMFSKAEELDDARQEAEAEAAKATLAKLTEDSSPSDEAPAEEAPPEALQLAVPFHHPHGFAIASPQPK